MPIRKLQGGQLKVLSDDDISQLLLMDRGSSHRASTITSTYLYCLAGT